MLSSLVLALLLLTSSEFRTSTAWVHALTTPKSIHSRPGNSKNIAQKGFSLHDSPTKLDSKLVYDNKSNRFYETSTNKQTGEEEFCLQDKDTGEVILLTKEEKERIFLDALQSYYYSGKNLLTDKQFDRLREDLSWEGSVLVTLNRNETLFINAVQAYARGQPVMTDAQFDELKTSLKESNSKLAVSAEPKCYLDTGVCKVTWMKDNIRTNSLYLPASFISTVIYLGVFYEIPFVRSFFNPLLLLAVGAVPIAKLSQKVTEEFLFREPLVARGPCPSCGTENKVFFGDVFGVKGDDMESTIKCSNCKCSMTVKRSSLRVSTLIPKAKGPAKPQVEEAE